MLKGIDNRLNAEVLYVLRSMGHGDTLVIADCNFPAESLAAETVHGSVIRMENLTAAQAAGSVLSVLPLDTFVPDFAMRMEVVDEQINVVSSALLGLTLSCARCHDHKYDEIEQREFFELYACLDNADEVNIQAL